MLKEARLIIPDYGRNGQPIPDWLRSSVEAILCKKWGGFTKTQGDGGYTAHNGAIIYEPITVYDIAVPMGPTTELQLTDLARGICNAARQECVYLRLCSGQVELVEPGHFGSNRGLSTQLPDRVQSSEKEPILGHPSDYDKRLDNAPVTC
jgi:hypothetical protein